MPSRYVKRRVRTGRKNVSRGSRKLWVGTKRTRLSRPGYGRVRRDTATVSLGISEVVMDNAEAGDPTGIQPIAALTGTPLFVDFVRKYWSEYRVASYTVRMTIPASGLAAGFQYMLLALWD